MSGPKPEPEFHLTTSTAAGICEMPPLHPADGPDGKTHFVGLKMWCRTHCPVCSGPPTAPEPVQPAEQGGLFR